MIRTPWQLCLFGILVSTAISNLAFAQVVPGTGSLLNTDDLENPNWAYVHNWPKSSKEEDEQVRYPLGAANNNMWFESPKRGAPDVVKRTETPAGGLAGSTGALYMRSRDTGIPGRPGHKQAQDDFILAAKPVSVAYSPNFMVRVYVPEWQEWEQRQGVSFGIRCGLVGPQTKVKESISRRFFRQAPKMVTEMEPFYPGFFIAFNPKSAPGNTLGDHAVVMIRSDKNGHEVAGPKITSPGWWTFGMSVTPDARCHYYAKPGIEDLTSKDYLYSSIPYNIPAQTFNTVFFNVCSADNGQIWSTPWIIDDPKVYFINGQTPAPQQAKAQQPVRTAQAPATTNNKSATTTAKPAATPAPSAAATPPATPVLIDDEFPVPPAQATPSVTPATPAPAAMPETTNNSKALKIEPVPAEPKPMTSASPMVTTDAPMLTPVPATPAPVAVEDDFGFIAPPVKATKPTTSNGSPPDLD